MGPNGAMPKRWAICGGCSMALWRGLVPRKRGSRRKETTMLLLAFASLAACSTPVNDFHVSESALL